jgi:predicted ABC-type ATPase
LIIIGGPNGKTTLTSYLIQKGRIKTSVINPDEIALKEFGGYGFHTKAAKAALERRKEAIFQNLDFAFETTFSGNSAINELLAAKAAGYYVALESMLDNVIRLRNAGQGSDIMLSRKIF